MNPPPNAVSTTDPCKLCTPLGAALAFHGIEGTICLLHGSQGCSTYIRRYLISHFKEPIDIASTNFSEEAAIFGGHDNFFSAVRNLSRQYSPQLIGVATTCLAETMGEQVQLYRSELERVSHTEDLPPVIEVSTPSYKGTHADGFHDAVRALIEQLALSKAQVSSEALNPAPRENLLVFPGMVSPADIRTLKDMATAFGESLTLVPDYSETLDGGLWQDYRPIPPGGTPLSALSSASRAVAWIELGRVLALQPITAGTQLNVKAGVIGHRLGWPVGVRETDKFVDTLAQIFQKPVPESLKDQRGRLLDAYADAHKVVSGVRVAVYGEEDLVVALIIFLSEIGVTVNLAATGGDSGSLKTILGQVLPEEKLSHLTLLTDADFFDLESHGDEKPELLIGSSKGFSLARRWNVPLLRVGFPIHDRFGGARIRLFGYAGTQEIFDRLVNAVLEKRQNENPAGYTYY
jgi:nitrogenase molybdenum-iron protein NifN